MKKILTLPLLFALLAPALASAAPSAQMQKNFDAMIADPADRAATVAYAKSAVAEGDYESAIPPLERLLMLNPADSSVRLEIGVLYHRLGSDTVARGYLEDVAHDEHASPESVKRASDTLEQL